MARQRTETVEFGPAANSRAPLSTIRSHDRMRFMDSGHQLLSKTRYRFDRFSRRREDVFMLERFLKNRGDATQPLDAYVNVVTPENIAFNYQVAGPHTRFLAFFLKKSTTTNEDLTFFNVEDWMEETGQDCTLKS